jgi:hypothetical protein
VKSDDHRAEGIVDDEGLDFSSTSLRFKRSPSAQVPLPLAIGAASTELHLEHVKEVDRLKTTHIVDIIQAINSLVDPQISQSRSQSSLILTIVNMLIRILRFALRKGEQKLASRDASYIYYMHVPRCVHKITSCAR